MKRVASLAALVVVIGLATAEAPLGATPVPTPTPVWMHRMNFDPALGGWLPKLPDGFEPWRQHVAVQTKIKDWFLYVGQSIGWQGPKDGTAFTYGSVVVR